MKSEIDEFEYIVAHNGFGSYAIPRSSDYTYTSKAILAGQVHEPETINFIVENCRGGDIIHAGAGFGDFLPALSKGCNGTIWAFEPNIENHYCAQKTIELNALGNVRLFTCALGDKSSAGRLKVTDHGLALGPRSEMCAIDNPDSETQECHIARIDDLFAERDVSVIHLDTEGYEFNILDGARELIQRCSPFIVLEIDGRALDYNNYMKSIGYAPIKQLIYDADEMVFVNTAYSTTASIFPS